MLINYVTPTEEELFKKYNPDLQRRSLEGREQRLKEANDFIAHLKEMGKSDKPRTFADFSGPVWDEDG